jgi:RNA polymerase sigma factor (sigma-70 family)
LKNALTDAFKKQQVYQKFIDSYELEEQMDDSEEERIIAQESDMTLQDMTEKYKSVLTKRQQEIIHYRFVEELSIGEIADILNINYQSVANSIQNSLKKIRNLYLK